MAWISAENMALDDEEAAAEAAPLLKAADDDADDADADVEQPPVPPAPGIIAPSGGEADCRICLERGPRSQMISPCACEGTDRKSGV